MSRPRSSPSWRKAPDYAARREAVAAFNASHRILKKGLALTPVKFGISFTTTHLNQAGALVLVYADGSIHLNHGGTEMGQGLMIKVAQVVADVFAVPIETREDQRDAHRQGAQHLGHRRLLGRGPQRHGREERRRDDQASASTPSPRRAAGGSGGAGPSPSSAAAPISRASRSPRPAIYATPKIHYDRASHRGRPFLYFAYGAALSEVVIDTLTGEHQGGRGRHPPRRRPLAQPGDRPRADRGRLHPGHGLADHRGAGVRRPRPPAHPRALDLQDPDRGRPPGAYGHARSGSAARMSRRRSTAPRRSASRR